MQVNKQFMLDIETTGIDPKNNTVLQVAIIEMTFSQSGYWEKGKEFNFFQHVDKEPESEFAKKYMTKLYEYCQKQPFVPAKEVRQAILDFFKSCQVEPPNIFISGWNVGIFDLPFLAYHKYIEVAHYSGDGKMEGDCHYRSYEISGALQFVANLYGETDVNPFLKKAEKLSPPIAKGSRHDALYDCNRQICILNGLIKMVKNRI